MNVQRTHHDQEYTVIVKSIALMLIAFMVVAMGWIRLPGNAQSGGSAYAGITAGQVSNQR
jgi:hypothetical protein